MSAPWQYDDVKTMRMKHLNITNMLACHHFLLVNSAESWAAANLTPRVNTPKFYTSQDIDCVRSLTPKHIDTTNKTVKNLHTVSQLNPKLGIIQVRFSLTEKTAKKVFFTELTRISSPEAKKITNTISTKGMILVGSAISRQLANS